MAIREILTGADNPALALRSAQVTTFGAGSLAEETVKDLGDTMLSREGLGLAAPQINRGLAVAVIGIPNANGKVTEYFPIINPRIIRFGGRELDHEECLSLPGVSLVVPRWTHITVKFQGLDGKGQRESLSGFEARVWQHEIDHLNGILITDRAAPAETRCGAQAGALTPRLGLFSSCVLPQGHTGAHQGGGTCGKHGDYIGDQCPKWPDCIPGTPK